MAKRGNSRTPQGGNPAERTPPELLHQCDELAKLALEKMPQEHRADVERRLKEHAPDLAERLGCAAEDIPVVRAEISAIVKSFFDWILLDQHSTSRGQIREDLQKIRDYAQGPLATLVRMDHFVRGFLLDQALRDGRRTVVDFGPRHLRPIRTLARLRTAAERELEMLGRPSTGDRRKLAPGTTEQRLVAECLPLFERCRGPNSATGGGSPFVDLCARVWEIATGEARDFRKPVETVLHKRRKGERVPRFFATPRARSSPQSPRKSELR